MITHLPALEPCLFVLLFFVGPERTRQDRPIESLRDRHRQFKGENKVTAPHKMNMSAEVCGHTDMNGDQISHLPRAPN